MLRSDGANVTQTTAVFIIAKRQQEVALKDKQLKLRMLEKELKRKTPHIYTKAKQEESAGRGKDTMLIKLKYRLERFYRTSLKIVRRSRPLARYRKFLLRAFCVESIILCGIVLQSKR